MILLFKMEMTQAEVDQVWLEEMEHKIMDSWIFSLRIAFYMRWNLQFFHRH